jgi:hypothetical protein
MVLMKASVQTCTTNVYEGGTNATSVLYTTSITKVNSPILMNVLVWDFCIC